MKRRCAHRGSARTSISAWPSYRCTCSPCGSTRTDIPPLLQHFIQHYNQKFRKNIQGLTKEAEELLMKYDWPGNIRELKNAIERVMILADGNRVGAKYLPIRISEGGALPVPMAEGRPREKSASLPAECPSTMSKES